MGVSFDVVPPHSEEVLPPGLEPERGAERVALEKARSVARRMRGALVLGADTLVVAEGRVLGKPRDREEARAFLLLLSGTTHRVVTGIALGRAPDGPWRTGHDSTGVTMRAIAAAEIEAYLDTGEWKGKAGAYAIQETADRFVTRLEGSRTNVVGLPVELVAGLLGREGFHVPSRPPIARGGGAG